MDRKTKLKLLAAYQLDFTCKAAVVLYHLFGRGPVDVEKFKKVCETSPLFRYDRDAYFCYVDTTLLEGGRLKEEEVAKIERVLDKVVPTRDLAKIAEYQLFSFDAVALLAFALFGLGPVDIRRLEDEAVQRLGIDRFSAQYIASRIADLRNGKYYLDDKYAMRIVRMLKVVDGLLSTRECARQRRGLASLIEKVKNFGKRQEPGKKTKLAMAIYERYGSGLFDPEELYRHVRNLYEDKTEYYLHLAEMTRQLYDKRYLIYDYAEVAKQYLKEERRRKARIGAKLKPSL